MIKIKTVFCFIFSLFLGSCGLESYVYLLPAERGNYTLTSADIYLPSGQPAEFRNYIIYYRIYLSETLHASAITLSSQRAAINTALENHFNILDRYTWKDNNSLTPIALNKIFEDNHYFSLYLSAFNNNSAVEISLDNTLNLASGLIEFDFTKTDGPTMTINSGTPLYLFRDNRSNAPRMDRFFIHTTNLSNENNITYSDHIDLQKRSDTTGPSSASYSYVSIYIMAFGTDSYYSGIFSSATHIGVFRLP